VIKETEFPEIPDTPQDTHLLLARGDTGILRYHLSNSSENGENPQGYLWLFGDSPEYDTVHKNSGTFLGVKMDYEPNGSINSFNFTREITGNLQEGWYSGFIQYTGLNKKQDVFWDSDKNNLDSPYKAVDPINLDSFTPTRVEQEFIKLEQSPQYADDILIPISVELVTPSISIGDYWEESDDIVIRGSTPVSNGTVISVVIDPDQYPLQRDLKAHTFNTTVQYKVIDGKAIKEAECITTITELNEGGYNATMYNGTAYNETSYNQTFSVNLTYANRTPTINPSPSVSKTKCTSVPRVFSIRIPLNWDEMALGKHWIQASVDSNGVKASMNKGFNVAGVWVNPTPTMELTKMIMIKQGETPVSHNETVTPTLSPTLNYTQPEDVYVTMVPVASNITTPVTIPVPPTPVATPAQPSMFSNPIAILIALFLVGGTLFVGWLYFG
jgi:hypothetical protein